MREKIRKLIEFFRDWENQSVYLKWMLGKTKPFLRPMLLIFILNLFITVVGIGSTVIMKHIIDGVTGDGQNFTTIGITLLVIFMAADIGMGAYNGILTTYINTKYSFRIRADVYDTLLRGVWMKIKAFHSGDVLTRLTSDINSIAGGISTIIPGILFFIIELIMAFCVLFHYDHFLALASLVIGPVGVLLSLIFSGKLKKYQVELNNTESQYRALMQESVENLAVLKSFEQENDCNHEYDLVSDKYLDLTMKRTKVNTSMNICIRTVFSLGYLVAFCWGIYRLSTGSITYGTMTVFLSLVAQVQQPIIGLGSMIPQFITVLACVGRVLDIDGIDAEERKEAIISADTKKIGIKLNNLTFGYGKETVLENVDLEIRPGDMVGLVGYSGAGKTTLACLVLSLLKANSGALAFYDETGKEEESSATARRFISYVPQGNTLISGTIADNLRAGSPDATEEEMWQALEIADAVAFMKDLETGLTTLVGENGMGLSEGQAQRIAIARAVIKAAPILILDEATSALDAKTEEHVIRSLCASDLLHTCIVITHRRSMLAYCSRALEIDGKQVKEITL